MLQTLGEILSYFLRNKKYWLWPALFWILLLGGIIALSSNAVIAPFIYTLF